MRLLLPALFFSLSLPAQSIHLSPEEKALHIKSISQRSEMNGRLVIQQSARYDTAGRCIYQLHRFSFPGTPRRKTEQLYYYDAAGRLLSEVRVMNDTLRDSTVSERIDTDRLSTTTRRTYRNDALHSVAKTTRDSAGFLHESYTLGKNDTMRRREIFSYAIDSAACLRKRVHEEKTVWAGRTYSSVETSEHGYCGPVYVSRVTTGDGVTETSGDSTFTWQRTINYDAKGNLVRREDETLDKNGYSLSRTTYDRKNRLQRNTIYTYENERMTSSRCTDRRGRVINEQAHRYTEKGLPLQSKGDGRRKYDNYETNWAYEFYE